jgi:hypothetical protein
MDDRKNDKKTAILLEALRGALADGDEHRLYKSGKLAGLFPSKNGPSGDAAAEAMRSDYLEHVRTEVKGKISIEWVRLTPRGIEFIYRHDSPRSVLNEMRGLMREARSGVPAWLDATLGQLQALSKTFSEEMQSYLQRLDAMSRRVEEALRRVDAEVPLLAEPMQALVPWGLEALSYLDHRKSSGKSDPCSLPELFSAIRNKHPHLSVPDFQKGLKRLADNRAVRLLPFAGTGLIPEPEHAIPDGAHMLYHACR